MGTSKRGTITLHDDWIDNPSPRRRFMDLGELHAYRELIAFLALRDLTVRYKQAAFGVAWAVVQPLVGALILTIVFRLVVRVDSGGIPYLLFAFLSYAVWTYFANGLSAATESLVGNAGLVTKVYFPRLAAPLAAVLPGLLDMMVALVATAGLMAALRVGPTVALVSLPLWIMAVCLVALGLGLIFATLNVRYRDAHHGYGLLVQVLFFASPVAYPSSLIDPGWRLLYYLNPMAGVLDGFRWSVLGAPAPPLAALISLLTGVVVLLVGLRYFASAERRFADVI
ncbi:MAG: ABC transporter permease [Mycobacteriales bacterium]